MPLTKEQVDAWFAAQGINRPPALERPSDDPRFQYGALTAPEQGWRDRLRGDVMHGVEALGGSPRAQRGVADFVGAAPGGFGLLDLVPAVGDTAAFGDAYEDFQQGDYGGAAVNAASGLLGAVPGAGAAAKTLATFIPVAAFNRAGLDEAARKAFDLKNQTARLMAKRGVSADEIWRKTGRAVEPQTGQWVMEIDDSAAKLTEPAQKKVRDKPFPTRAVPRKVSDALDHPELYAAYPQAADVPMQGLRDVQNSDVVRGAYDPGAGTIDVRRSLDDPTYLRTLGHEVNHQVQRTNGLPTGGNVDQAGSYEDYMRLPGEGGPFGSHNVENRWDMTPAERLAAPPWETAPYDFAGVSKADREQGLLDQISFAQDAPAGRPGPTRERAGTLDRTVRKVKKTEAKGIPGAPLGVTTKQGEAARRKAYKDTVVLGAGGADWYDDSGKALLDHVRGDTDLAQPLTEAMAITSAGTSVGSNTGFGVKGHNQAVMGMPVNTGRFPVKMSEQIEEAYRTGADSGVTGNKRTPFADQLAIGGGFYRGDRQGHRAVHDIWDGEAWGYTNAAGQPFRETFSDAQHRWMDDQMEVVMSDLNRMAAGGRTDWTPGRTQAAAWTGAKIKAQKLDPKDAAYSYADDLPRHYAQGSRETVPGSNTGHMQGLLSAPYELQKTYDDEVAKVIYDAKGNDRIAAGNRAMTGGHIEGPGVYEGVNPGRQTLTAVGAETPAEGPKVVDAASRAMMDANESAFGLLGAQKAAAWSKTFPGGKAADRMAEEVTLPGGTLTNDQAYELLARGGVDTNRMAIVPTPGGVRLVNFGYDKDEFTSLVKGIAKDFGGSREAVMFDGNYIENAWDSPEGRFGQQYMEKIDRPDIPILGQNFDQYAPEIAGKMRDLDQHFAKTYGFEVSPHIQELRAAIASSGRQGVYDLVQKLGLGLAAVPAMIIAAEELGLLQPEEEPTGGLL